MLSCKLTEVCMIKKTLPFLLAAALGLSASAMVQAAGTAPKSKSVPLSQQVQDLRETVLQLQKQVDYLEMLVPPSTAVLMPDARKLSSIRVNGATFLMSIDKPSGNAKGSDFVLTIVNPQSITYTNVAFDIRVYGRDANGDPNAYTNALLVSRVTPALAPGQTTQFRFAVPGMSPEDFTAAYVASMTFGGIASPATE
jgi:hypothetical protein